ncbi:WAT1-related protein At1g68170-like [Typha angustifolia]|uniref:WAT1-related protein At1g68170-like n=1 Tax=Typha angustifolia TaxID=59011 RepID=UPI003C2FF056
MMLIQLVFAGINILYKLALDDGMDVRILVAYRYLFAMAFLCPLAFFLERKSRPRLTWRILMQSFFCGLFGGTLSQMLYINSMKLTSATFVSAMTNLTPPMTFILAVSCRLESLEIKKAGGQAKVIGTLLGLSGAMLLTFYKGAEIKLWLTSINLLKTDKACNQQLNLHRESGNRVLGSFLAVASCFSYAIWLIIQAKIAEVYPCHYSSAALTCMMCALQAIIFAVSTQRHTKEWKLGFNIRLLSAAYAGIVASGSIFPLLAWCIQKRGPLYASVFNPLMLLFVAILSSILLSETLHIGSILGAVLIVIGLYIVLWGKGRERGEVHEQLQVQSTMESIEIVAIPSTNPSPGNKSFCDAENKGDKFEAEEDGP